MLDQLKNCNFGPSRSNATGSTGVGYTLLDVSGSIVAARTTTGVYQLTSGSGIYAAYVSFPDSFRGQLLWDTGAAFSSVSYATEEYNVEANNPKIDTVAQAIGQMSGTIAQLYHATYGRWQIVGNQMIMFQDDNATELVRFNLFDDAGVPTMDQVFQRTKV